MVMFDRFRPISVLFLLWVDQDEDRKEGGRVVIHQEPEKRLLTPEEAAKRLSVSPETIKKWLRAGKLNGVKVSVLWRVREEDLEDFIQRKGKQ